MKNRQLKIVLALSTIVVAALITAFWYSLPDPLFSDPYCTVMEDRDGNLLGARIADDSQWRFPENPDVPVKFRKAICTFEDKRFYSHPGVDPMAMGRALYQNIKEGEIVSGGSTLTMQVVRLMRKDRPRTVSEKIVEMILALRMEMSNSKEEILALYASHAPFGGNIVGLDAAAWRYFNRPPAELSWAETATLAVLPNAPALIHPGRNRDKLLEKRNRLLEQLYERKLMDSITLVSSLLEPLPQEPYPLPMDAPHLLNRIYAGRKGERVRTTLDPHLQNQVAEILRRHHKFWADNHVHNAAVIVAEVGSGNVLAYHGNTPVEGPDEFSYKVDVVTAPRSSGSVLKPVLFAAMNDAGELLPTMLVPDVPVQLGGFTPKNFSHSYDGAVPAEKALSRSLNIPSVFMLKEYGIERFHSLLKELGIHTIDRPAGHYGLSLILGGAEVTLWDLAGMYAGFSRTLNHFHYRSGKYHPGDLRELNFYDETKHSLDESWNSNSILTAGAIWQAYKAMVHVNRPGSLSNWQSFSSMGKVAWKTGTSFGFRDAWAVGTTPGYVVAVWVGNADGEGRPGLTGTSAAAPVMFDVFSLLPASGWFEMPYEELEYIPVCRQSGHRAGQYCTDTLYKWVCNKGLQTPPCPYHRLVSLDRTGTHRVSSECVAIDDIRPQEWFVLPPMQEWYYAQKNPGYRVLPPFLENCRPENEKVMDFIFPNENSKIFIPTELDGEKGKAVFKLAHRNAGSTVHWHLDDEYLTSTSGVHQVGLAPAGGEHVITVVDENGNAVSRSFEVVN